MYHGRFKGSHYECGYHWGALLYKNNKIIVNQDTFIINDKRKTFAKKCIPIYQKYYPEILNEIKGIADGQTEKQKYKKYYESILVKLLILLFYHLLQMHLQ